MERRGIPSAVICTDLFRVSVTAVSRALGMANYPVVYTPHPVADLSEDELRIRARKIAPEVKDLLTMQIG